MLTSEATSFVDQIHEDFEAVGYGIGIYGPVARGESGDLDLVVWANGGGSPDSRRVLSVFRRHGCLPDEDETGPGYMVLALGHHRVHVRILTGATRNEPVGDPGWMSGPLRPMIDRS